MYNFSHADMKMIVLEVDDLIMFSLFINLEYMDSTSEW